MQDYEYTVKEGDTLSNLSEKFYGAKKHYSHLADYNKIENPDVIQIDQVIKMPRILKTGVENGDHQTIIHLVYRRSSALNSEGEVLEAYFEDGQGKKTNVTRINQTVFMVVKTSNLVGKKIDIDVSDAAYKFEYMGEYLGDDLLKGFEVTDDEVRIELKTTCRR